MREIFNVFLFCFVFPQQLMPGLFLMLHSSPFCYFQEQPAGCRTHRSLTEQQDLLQTSAARGPAGSLCSQRDGEWRGHQGGKAQSPVHMSLKVLAEQMPPFMVDSRTCKLHMAHGLSQRLMRKLRQREYVVCGS